MGQIMKIRRGKKLYLSITADDNTKQKFRTIYIRI